MLQVSSTTLITLIRYLNPGIVIGILSFRRLALTLTISAFCSTVTAQSDVGSSQLEQLTKELMAATADVDKINACRKIGDILKDTATQRAITYELKALKIAEQAGLELQRHVSFVRLADGYSKTGAFDKVLEYLWKCNPDLLETTFDKYLFHRLYGSIMATNLFEDSARIHYDMALELSKALDDGIHMANVYNEIANMLTSEHRFSESIVYYIEALEGYKKVNSKRGEVVVLGNIAVTHMLGHNFQQALDYALEAKAVALETNFDPLIAFAYATVSAAHQALHQYEEALQAIQQAITIFSKLGYISKLQNAYSTLGEILLSLDRGEEAKQIFIESLNMMGQPTRSTASGYAFLGNIYMKENQFEKGLQYLDSAVKTAIKLEIPDLTWKSYESLSDAYAKAGKHDLAYQHLKQFIALKDSALNREKRAEFQALEARYKNQLKEESIRNLQAENNVKDLQLYILGLAAIILAMAAVFIYLRYRNNLKLRKQLQDLDKLKSHFFINISHEYRTPLSLIMAPLRRHLESEANSDDKQEFAMMYRNAERLSTLTNQVLELAKLESGSSKLQVQHTDISALLNITWSYFLANANNNQIRYEFIKSELPVVGWIDSDKIEQVVCNLLSNAFKFTPAGGTITLKASVQQGQLKIEVQDSGPGIPPEHTSLIFNRFYQIPENGTRTTQGSGVGLTLCKEIMELHRGTITFTSSEGFGSTFIITLSVNKHDYKTDEIVTDNVEKRQKAFTGERYVQPLPMEPSPESESHPLLLIVEDNRDMSDFLSRMLAGSYRVITALNGAEGWKQAAEFIPDIIISDIMMPEMDGIEMCRKIRMHEMTSHIPLIMLTARADQASRIEGLTTGADVYLAKPFDPKELFVSINNLLKRREGIRKYIMTHASYESAPPQIDLPQADKLFMEKLNTIMKLRHGDEAFDVEEFADEINMSRTQFYRKVRALTGISPGELIRDFRLGIACTLLKQQGLHVNEVCYKVGFSSVSNFIKIFKDHTGYTPGEYKAMQALPIEMQKAENAYK